MGKQEKSEAGMDSPCETNNAPQGKKSASSLPSTRCDPIHVSSIIFVEWALQNEVRYEVFKNLAPSISISF
jgi:hypothetical protein